MWELWRGGWDGVGNLEALVGAWKDGAKLDPAVKANRTVRGQTLGALEKARKEQDGAGVRILALLGSRVGFFFATAAGHGMGECEEGVEGSGGS